MPVFSSYNPVEMLPVSGAGNYPPSNRVFGDHSSPQAANLVSYPAVSVTSNLPISEREAAISSYNTFGTGFDGDYFNRIHIIPSQIDLGNLVSAQQRDVVVFNAYSDPRDLNNITVSGGDGLTLDGPSTPLTFSPREQITYNLRAETSGPAEIEADYLFDWATDSDDFVFSVVGQRIVNFPYQFSSPATETLEWFTEVLTSRNATTEQRVRIRNSPRQSFRVTYPIPPNQMQNAENLLYGWLQRKWAIPLWNELQEVGPLSSADTVITVDTTNTDHREEGLILVYQAGVGSVTVETPTLTATQLNLARPLGVNFTNAVVMPVRIGRITNKPQRNTNGLNGSLLVNYEILENTTLSTTDPQQYKGRDVYFDEVLMGGTSLRDEYEIRIDANDYRSGVVEFTSPWEKPRIIRPKRVLLDDLDDIWQYRLWLHRRAGRYVDFWLPTFESNFRITGTGNIVSGFDVKTDGYGQFATKREDIAIKLLDGTWELREITGTVSNPNNTETILIDTPLNRNYEEIEMVCYLGLKRLNTDRVELRWNQGRVVDSTVTMVEL